MRYRALVFGVLFYCLSALFHWVAWRWLRRIAPAWAARYRRPTLVSMGVMVALPLGQQLAFVHPIFGNATLIGLGFLWFLTMAMGTTAIGAMQGIGWVCDRVARRARVGSAATVEGAAAATMARVAEGVAVNAADDAPSAGTAPRVDRRRALESLGGVAALAASGAVVGWGALRGRYDWSIEEVPIRLSRLPKALDGFTIVQISDIHVGRFIGERQLTMGLDRVRGLRADLIVITGDIIDSDAAYVPLAARHLGALSAREGVVCIPGNHDYYAGASATLAGMQAAGIEVLRNRGKVLAAGDGGLALLGVDDMWARQHRGPGPDLALARSMVRPDLATVLLAHQPRFAPVAAAEGIDLQLSGHTHGGQINPGFRPIDLFYEHVAGRYDVGAMQLYVNRGFGTVGPPARIGAPPEITKIVLVAG